MDMGKCVPSLAVTARATRTAIGWMPDSQSSLGSRLAMEGSGNGDKRYFSRAMFKTADVYFIEPEPDAVQDYMTPVVKSYSTYEVAKRLHESRNKGDDADEEARRKERHQQLVSLKTPYQVVGKKEEDDEDLDMKDWLEKLSLRSQPLDKAPLRSGFGTVAQVATKVKAVRNAKATADQSVPSNGIVQSPTMIVPERNGDEEPESMFSGSDKADKLAAAIKETVIDPQKNRPPSKPPAIVDYYISVKPKANKADKKSVGAGNSKKNKMTNTVSSVPSSVARSKSSSSVSSSSTTISTKTTSSLPNKTSLKTSKTNSNIRGPQTKKSTKTISKRSSK